jgi:NADH-quinone oxidoreductase subunit F
MDRTLLESIGQRMALLRLKAQEDRTNEGGQLVVEIGMATCGQAAGAVRVAEAFEEELGSRGGRLLRVGCIGHCYAEPMAVVRRPGWPPILYGYLTAGKARSLIERFLDDDDPALEWALGAMEPNDLVPAASDMPRFAGETRRLLRRCGIVDPQDIESSIAAGVYEGLARALSMTPSEIIEMLRRSDLRGLGGGGFPTWRKWEACRHSPATPRYVICNADEGDPGAFMDRTIIESDPHSVLEGMIIAGHAIGSTEGYIYVRREYPLAVERLETAISQASAKGLLGEDILGSGIDFRIRIAQGAGAFVCGESTALMYSIEGKRGMPRVRPPRSAEAGLFGKPTLLNNVKTYSSVAYISSESPEVFASVGTRSSKGTAVFALAGKILNTGLVEVSMGTTLREIVFDIGGGVPPARKGSTVEGETVLFPRRFKAVQIGGPSGGCLPEDELDTPIDFDALQRAGAMMGSGGMVILDEDNCAVETARYFLEFTQRESCGKCTFCRIGTKHMLDILERITRGEGTLEDLDRLETLGEDIKAGSLCNLGKTAPNPVLTTLSFFRDEYEAHIREKRCPAKECKPLSTYLIDLDNCMRSCDACVGSCPVEAIYTRPDGLKAIDQSKCVKCHSCWDACPPAYDAVVKVSPIPDPEEP